MAKNVKYNAADIFGDIVVPDTPVNTENEKDHDIKEPDASVAEKTEAEEERGASFGAEDTSVSGGEMKVSIKDELEGTRGRKGQKLERLTFTVTHEVFEYVDKESRRRGISRRQFVNEIITQYKNSPEGRAVID